MALELNGQLKSRITTLREELGHAAITYVDVYATKYELISNAREEIPNKLRDLNKHSTNLPLKILGFYFHSFHIQLLYTKNTILLINTLYDIDNVVFFWISSNATN